MQTHLSPAPQKPSYLAIAGGLGGLIPFIGLTLLLYFGSDGESYWAYKVLLNYTALIATFIGAIWWGLALELQNHPLRRFMFAWSLTACLVALIILSSDSSLALILFISLFAFQLLLDFRFLWRNQLIPSWFWKLRCVLTSGVILTLGLAALWSHSF